MLLHMPCIDESDSGAPGNVYRCSRWPSRDRSRSQRENELRILQTSRQSEDGVRLCFQAWEPDGRPRAIVALVHGLGEHVARHAPLGLDLVGAGYALMGFDLRGHGRSDGLRGDAPSYEALLKDIDSLMDWVRTSHPGLPILSLIHI